MCNLYLSTNNDEVFLSQGRVARHGNDTVSKKQYRADAIILSNVLVSHNAGLAKVITDCHHAYKQRSDVLSAHFI